MTTLSVLTCSACGAPVPLGDGDVTTCESCQADVVVPEEHRRLRDAERAQAAQRAGAELLYRRLAEPPPLLLRLWGRFPLGLVFAIGGILAIGAGFLLYFQGLAWLGEVLDAHVDDVFTLRQRLLMAAGPPLFVLGFLLVLGSYGGRRLLTLRRLRAALQARAPVRPGGRALCRHCAAPLEVPRRALGVRCLYCRADNLVSPRPGWIARVEADAASVERGIEEAWASYRRAAGRVRWGALGRLALLALPVLALYFLVSWAIGPPPSWPPPWRSAVHSGHAVIQYTGRQDGEITFRTLPARTPCPQRPPAEQRFTAFECDRAGCGHVFAVALRHGEVLRAFGQPGHSLVHFYWRTRRLGVTSARLDGAARFPAPLSGWYRLDLDVPGARAGDAFTLCLDITRDST